MRSGCGIPKEYLNGKTEIECESILDGLLIDEETGQGPKTERR